MNPQEILKNSKIGKSWEFSAKLRNFFDFQSKIVGIFPKNMHLRVFLTLLVVKKYVFSGFQFSIILELFGTQFSYSTNH